MGDLYVRRTTAFLLFVIAALCIAVVALLVFLFADKPQTDPKLEDPPNLPSTSGKLEQSTSAVPLQRWEREYRIPKETYPVHYDLYLHPDLETGLFTGKVSIQVSVSSPIDFLVTHVKTLNITSTKLKSLDNNQMLPLDDFFEYEPNQFWVLKPSGTLKRGNYSMALEFSGSLEDKIVGFYRSVYTSASGEKR